MLPILSAALPILDKVLDRVIPDEAERAKAKLEMQAELVKNEHDIQLAQIELNKAEAQHRSIYVAGWRPFIGYVCGVAFLYHFVLQPVLIFAIAVTGYTMPTLPDFEMDTLLTVLAGLLGLGGLRSLEKIKKVSK